mgnify:FL=1
MNTSDKIPFGVGAILSPVPAVIVTCGTLQKPNALTIAWTGTLCSNPPKTYISVRPERYSYDIIKSSGEFCINLTTAELARATDYLGVRSGRNEDKLKRLGLSVSAAQAVSAPILDASPLSIECRVERIVPLGSHDMIIADIVAVDAAKELLDENGRLRLDKAGLLAYSHGEYFSLGRKVGKFGYSVRKKK